MLKHRVIPALLLQNGGLVKTRQFKDPKYVGDPINAIRIFNDKEVDELIVLDINASKDHIPPDYETIELFASECFMPLCYGGGISSLAQAKDVFNLGVEKISLQSAAIDDLNLVSKIAECFGSQSVVVSVDIKKNWRNTLSLYDHRKKNKAHYNWLEFCQLAIEAGAGEILINAVDQDGLMKGYDLDLIRQLAQEVSVPIIALGGAGTNEDFKSAVKAGASAVAAGSMFVFHGPHRAVLITYPKYDDLEKLFY